MKILEGWSPEQIAGRLKKENRKTIICHETIYDFIYDPENKDKKLWEYQENKSREKENPVGRFIKAVFQVE
ncbi:MAG: hypothetical protein M1150_04350 [Patescibacteria group bacterium]|nr:hypothetical protein [Patescibacteria group bacterium]